MNLDHHEDLSGPQSHPYLHEPFLYITNVPAYISDHDLSIAFANCGPFRPSIVRDDASSLVSGTIEFRTIEKAEKALATLQSRIIPNSQPPAPLVLSPYPGTIPATSLPPPSAFPRLVKQLPPDYPNHQLYDLFRPFGALASVRTQIQLPGTAIVEFWNEENARTAEEALHCAEIEGQNISVQMHQAQRASQGVPDFSINAPPFVPGVMYTAFTTQHSPPRGSPYSMGSPVASPFVHGPGQQVQLAPLIGPGSNSHSGLIDFCNLFCKNLDTKIDSNELFSHFHQFGQIVSARVMRDNDGESRGFGFVSYQTAEQAATAMHAMNGAILRSKQIAVRLHEPKKFRQEKLAQRYGHKEHPKNLSGATSPAASDAGDSYAGFPSPRRSSLSLGSPKINFNPTDRGRRGSGSNYNAAVRGTLNLPMRYDDLAGLSPVVRKEVLTSEFNRRIKPMENITAQDVESIVDSLVSVSLSKVLQCIEDPEKLQNQIDHIKLKHLKHSSEKSPARSSSLPQDSRLLDSTILAATASAPDHPSTPISVDACLMTPPRTSSPSGSILPLSERDRMMAAVSKLESSLQSELTELLMSLPKRDRAMCLFNTEVLRVKLVDAKVILECLDEHDEKMADESRSSTKAIPVTPHAKLTALDVLAAPCTPELTSSGRSAASSPCFDTPGNMGSTYTVASLARLPAADIIRIASTSSVTGLLLPKSDPVVVQATDEFIDGLIDKPMQVQKQLLGDKLYKVVKTFGIKKGGAPKITITLLDQEDLRALAHLMNSYPSVLKDKVLSMMA